MSVRSAVRAVVVSVLALATVPALVPGVANATTTAVNCPGDDLQTAINAATTGDTLNVIGHCTGDFTIDKNLTVQGDGSTVLDGNAAGVTLTVTGTPTVNLTDLTVTGGNRIVGSFGGGIYNDAGSLTLSGVTVSGNTVTVGGGVAFGGGILNGGTLTMTNSTVSGNTATGSNAIGGGISNAGTLTVVDSTVSGNTATGGGLGEGGGIYMNNGTLTMTNSTVSGNTATATGAGGLASGGGVFSFVPTTIINTTIAGNAVTSSGVAQGGGILGNMSPTAAIISGNTVSGTTTFGPDCEGSITSGGYNLVGNTTNCSGFVATDLQNVDPNLDTLTSNGGPTQTMGLLPGSPAIGDIPLTTGGACVVGQATDQRGVLRPQGAGCDIGAVEKGRTITTVRSSLNPSTSGQVVTFTVQVCANPSSLPTTPTGTVTLRDGGGGPVLASGSLAFFGGHCGSIPLQTSTLAAGKHKIVGIYSGDGVNTRSRGSVIQRVKT